MKKIMVFLILIIAFIAAIGVWLGVTFLSGLDFESFGDAQPNKEVVTVYVEREGSCADDIHQYNQEVEARIEAAVLLERAQNQAALEAALGPMKIFEDGSFRDEDGNGGCITYTLCDDLNPTLWYPQDVFVPPH